MEGNVIMKMAFIFPGQGSQYVGMGKDIAEKFNDAMEIYNMSNEILGFDIKKLCFEGPETELIRMEISQSAILTTSIAILKVVKNFGIIPQMMAGLSLGEFTALVASGSISFADMLKFLGRRREYMLKAFSKTSLKGGMAAIIGLSKETIVDCIKECSQYGIVDIAYYNSLEQIVITGELSAVKKTAILCKNKGANRVAILPFILPFHSRLLEGAKFDLYKDLSGIKINEPLVPVVSNFSANKMKRELIPQLITKQMYNCVKWVDCINYMISQEINTFIEIGPKNTLSKFVSQINPTVNIYNVEDIYTLNKLIEKDKMGW